MTYEEFRLLCVSDDPADRERARQIASGHPLWAETLAADARLLDAARLWRDEAPPWVRARTTPVRRRARWPRVALVAASLVLGIPALVLVIGGADVPRVSDGELLAGRALTDVDVAMRDHRRAIGALESAGSRRLALLESADLRGDDASRLLVARARLEALDGTIARLEEYLASNPLHRSARLALLDAYQRKRSALDELVRREDRA